MSNENRSLFFKKNVKMEKAESNLCNGPKGEDCPHNRVFNSSSPYCKECTEDAMEAIEEAYYVERKQ